VFARVLPTRVCSHARLWACECVRTHACAQACACVRERVCGRKYVCERECESDDSPLGDCRK